MSLGINFGILSGIVNTAPYTPFFDKFANGLDGWSLDRLVTGYAAPILTIVRPSDLATQDIFLSGNSIDQAAILSFVGTQKALVKNVYGQLGNHNLEQLTVAKMPIIADGGAIKTDGGKPCIEFDGIDDELRSMAGYSLNKAQMSALVVSRSLELTNARMQFRLGDGSGQQIYINWTGSGSTINLSAGSPGSPTTLYSYTQALNRQLIDYFVGVSNASRFGIDGSDVGFVGTQTGIDNLLVIGNWQSGTTYATKMNFQELVLFDNADRTAEKSAMRANINSRYTIY